MTVINMIPTGLETGFLRETESDTMPEIRREGANVVYPAFIREETINDEAGTRTVYRYFNVTVPYTGQNLTDEAAFVHASYSALRKHFYGDYAVQNEQILKGTFAAHQYSVRQAFPKSAGETLAAVERFNSIKAEFWAAVDAACALVGKTRADLPAKFNAETMLTFAAENGMSASDIGTYTAEFSVISLNLLQNGRNWDEMF